MRNTKTRLVWGVLLLAVFGCSLGAVASEADMKIPPLDTVKFDGLGGISGTALMYLGILICAIGATFGLVQYKQTKALPVHASMSNVSNMIWVIFSRLALGLSGASVRRTGCSSGATRSSL